MAVTLRILDTLNRKWVGISRQIRERVPARHRNRSALTDDTYARWIDDNEPGQRALDAQRKMVSEFPYQPLITILTPVYNPHPAALRETIQSVLDQTYPNWELCIVDGGSDRPLVKETLKEFATCDRRVQLATLERNLGISGNSNTGLQQAKGEYVAFLDHDDKLAPFALFELVQLLNQDRRWDLIYSDHDVLSADGKRRSQPLFKPDWSPEIMFSANYITHLTVIRSILVKEAGGFNPDMDGAQDWDLFLRVIERTTRIAHISKVLYHWRESAGSTAINIYAKSYAPPAQLRSIQQHLSRLGLTQATAYFDESGFIRVGWFSPKTSKVSIIIPTKGSNPLLEKCVDSILRHTTYPIYEIIIVNNGDRRPAEFKYFRTVSQDERITVVHYAGPFNYSSVNNFGTDHATGRLLLFLNNDTEVIASDWLDELALWAERPEIGAVGAKLVRPDGTIQHAGVIVGLTGFAGHVFEHSREGRFGVYGLTEWYRNYLAVTGACLMVRREVFEQVGGWNEEFLLCGNDVEFCFRVKAAGYRIVYNPFAKLSHVEAATRKTGIPFQDFQISFNHYAPVLEAGDPYYNANLSYWSSEPSLRKRGEPLPLDFAKDFLRIERKTGA